MRNLMHTRLAVAALSLGLAVACVGCPAKTDYTPYVTRVEKAADKAAAAATRAEASAKAAADAAARAQAAADKAAARFEGGVMKK